ncbi:YgfZ/GcvT domain-containing protein [Mariprofundus ferrooxydans]|uniref:CAF17-like 4Fe-4S cluster assembly/insertion protein YgfZ n=1 Tax=Mariprofundus ferrooxydans TaxID=314344 RepID=UPI000361FE8B|nr:folate-binding protein YgfZ [Mariprofundus ferrooxydans]
MSLHLPLLSPQTAELLLNGSVMAERRNWSVLKASGPTVRDYLQGQITQDMNRLSADCAIHTALLTPQGKAVTELYIIEGNNDELILLTPASYATATVARLRQFALGQELRIGVVEALAICSLQGTHAHSQLERFALPEPDEMWLATSRNPETDCFAIVMPHHPRGYWVVTAATSIRAVVSRQPEIEQNAFEAMRIIRGFPDFGIEWDAAIHPLNANLVEFDGVSFEKGCYVGQEVTSRMHWRGGIKKKLYRVSVDGRPDTLPCPIRTSVNIGELKSAAIDQENRCIGIALLPIETAESATALSLKNGATLHVLEACHA